MNNRPDFSNYLVHFTSNRAPFSSVSKIPVENFEEMNAYEKLASILESKKIYASKMPRTGANAVCFTECPWSSLLSHTAACVLSSWRSSLICSLG